MNRLIKKRETKLDANRCWVRFAPFALPRRLRHRAWRDGLSEVDDAKSADGAVDAQLIQYSNINLA
jgi:hypothetical protein